jgi:hypothetical protein
MSNMIEERFKFFLDMSESQRILYGIPLWVKEQQGISLNGTEMIDSFIIQAIREGNGEIETIKKQWEENKKYYEKGKK